MYTDQNYRNWPAVLRHVSNLIHPYKYTDVPKQNSSSLYQGYNRNQHDHTLSVPKQADP